MKIKLKLTSLFVVAILFSTPSSDLIFANTFGNVVNEEEKEEEMDPEEEIELQGALAKSTIRSLIKPFRATVNNHSVNIYYLQDLSNISIEITNESGQVVYSTNVSPTYGGSLHIGISSWTNGFYTIRFANSSGNSIYGSFEI